MYDKRRKNGISAMAMMAMFAGMTCGTGLLDKLPEPKPPKELTDEDKARIQEAAERRQRRNEKRRGYVSDT